MLGKLKIQGKIGLGFGMILLLMLIMAAIGLTKAGHIKSDVEDIANDRYPKVVLGNNVIKHPPEQYK